MARAGRRQLEGVDEQTLVRFARVEGQHAVVNVLLEALAEVAWRQGTTGSFWEQAGLDTLSLVVLGPGDFLDDDAPLSGNVLGAQWSGVLDVGRADESLSADPVTLVELLAVVE